MGDDTVLAALRGDVRLVAPERRVRGWRERGQKEADLLGATPSGPAEASGSRKQDVNTRLPCPFLLGAVASPEDPHPADEPVAAAAVEVLDATDSVLPTDADQSHRQDQKKTPARAEHPVPDP